MQSYYDYRFVMQVSVMSEIQQKIHSTQWEHKVFVSEQLFLLLAFKKRTALLWFPQKQQRDNLKIHT